MVGHNVGTFLQRARSGRGCLARASAGDRAVVAQGGLASLCSLQGSSPHYRRPRPGPAARGVGVGKRRWYATIFSFDRPRSRSISTERRGRFPSRAGFTPRSSSPWPLPCRALVFTRASVFIPRPSLPFSRQCGAHIAFMAYLSSLTGMRRLAVAPSEWLGGAFASPSRGEATPLACGAEAVANQFLVFSAFF